AAACLASSEIVVRGHASRPDAPLAFDAATQPLLLYPTADAISLERFSSSPRPVTLVVPDGTWRQASKVRRRVAGLEDVPCVFIARGAPSSYRLRAEAHEGRLSTIEAIARAMGMLEGPLVQRALELVFRAVVERTLWARGVIARSAVSG